MPLAGGTCSSPQVRIELAALRAGDIFAGRHSPRGMLAGLYLYFSCMDEAHEVAQALNTPEGCFWHGVLHRQEPDPGNAAYWFRRAGAHPVYPKLRQAAVSLVGELWRVPPAWDPFQFIEVCEQARVQPGSDLEIAARAVQRAEWQLLFDYCARRETTSA